MEFIRPQKVMNIINNNPKIQKYGQEAVSFTDGAKKIIASVKNAKSLEDVKNILSHAAEPVDGLQNMFKSENNLFQITNFAGVDSIVPSQMYLNKSGIKSCPKVLCHIDINGRDGVLVYDLGTKEKLIPLTKTSASDRAKSEFYEDIKKMIDTKYVDAEELMKSDYWLVTKDGSRILNLKTNLGGYITNEKQEPLKKQIYDILFN